MRLKAKQQKELQKRAESKKFISFMKTNGVKVFENRWLPFEEFQQVQLRIIRMCV